MRLLLSNYHAQWGWRASTGQSRQNVRVRLFLGSKDGNAAAEKGGKASLFNFSLSAFAGGEV
jgi:hypothetical protein